MKSNQPIMFLAFVLFLAVFLTSCGGPINSSSVVETNATSFSATNNAETPTLEQGLRVLSDKGYALEEYGTMEVLHKGRFCTLAWMTAYGYEALSFDVICDVP